MKKINALFALAGLFLLTAAFEMTTISKTVIVDEPPENPYLSNKEFDYDIPFPDYLAKNNPWVKQNAYSLNTRMTSDIATLGRVLFYDKRLSGNFEISCASCHKQEFAFADNLPLSEGIHGQKTKRNSPNLNDLGWRASYQPLEKPLLWDGKETDLKKMVLIPISHGGEMGSNLDAIPDILGRTDYYPSLFEAAYGDATITKERIGEALAMFIESFNVFDSKYDAVKEGLAAFTEEELRGEQLFKDNCAVCHRTDQFIIDTPVSNSLSTDDPGYWIVTGNQNDVGKFRSPSLRNIELTAPYMHDGSMQTLEEVLIFYSDSLPEPTPNPPMYYNPDTGEPFSLVVKQFSDQDIQDLLGFLKTLTSEELVSHEKFSDPFEMERLFLAQELKQKFTIAPNPVVDKTTVQFNNPTNEEYQFKLLNSQGQTFLNTSTQTGSIEIERNGLSAGIYFLEIKKGGKQKVERVLIQ